jgi:lipocalin
MLLYKMDAVRYCGKWYRINAKPYEPERQTNAIAWMLIQEPLLLKEEAYRKYFEKQRQEAKVLYPTFNKDGTS